VEIWYDSVDMRDMSMAPLALIGEKVDRRSASWAHSGRLVLVYSRDDCSMQEKKRENERLLSDILRWKSFSAELRQGSLHNIPVALGMMED
jgi:hypothetical protein